MAVGLTPNELRRLQEFAAAGRRGRIANAGSRSGLAHMITKRYITERAVSAYSVLYVITDRGRRVLAEAKGSDVDLPAPQMGASRGNWGGHVKEGARDEQLGAECSNKTAGASLQ
jgi:hypothetical protein